MSSIDRASGPVTGSGPDSDPDSAARLAGLRFLRSFDGLKAGADILAAIRAGRASGVTLFRGNNVASPAQVRALCASLQAARPPGDPPLVIGFDQEGGQLQTVGDGATAWPGNLALGAAGSEELALRAGRAIGVEVAAMGGTLDYAPVCDVLHPTSATPLGTRPFGDDPLHVAALAAALTRGLQQAGIAATLKHFPGHGSAVGDSHRLLPVLAYSASEMQVEALPPFKAAIAAGAMAVMPGHLAAPAMTGGVEIPATFSPDLLDGLLRGELGFDGVIVSDALDMAGGAFGHGLGEAACAAVEAGIDLLLLNHDPATEEAAFETLRSAIASGRLDVSRLETSRERILRTRSHFSHIDQPSLEVVGCVEYRRLAREIADASITLVRDPGHVLPLRVGSGGRVAVIAPELVDLTPAETSSYLRLGLADQLRARGLAADEFVSPLDPSPSDVAALKAAIAGHQVVIACTFDAVSFPGQVALVSELTRPSGIGTAPGRPTVAVALRSPYDVTVFPAWATSVCTYGVQPPQIEALADALLGRIEFRGRLPVRLEAAR